MRLQRRQRSRGRHIRHQPQVELGYSAMGEDRLAARPGVSGHQAFDVHRGARYQQFQRFEPVHIVHPMFHAELFLGHSLALPPRRFPDHGFLSRAQRARLLCVIIDSRRVAVRTNQRRQRLHQTPRRTVHARFIARMDIEFRAASPVLAARDQLQLNDALRAERRHYRAIQRLHSRRHEHTRTFSQCGQHLRPANHLRKMRRADFLLPFGHQYQVHRKLASRVAEAMQGREKGGLWPFLVYRPAAHQRFSNARFVHQRSLKWWR